MKKILLTIAAVLMALVAQAIPANPTPRTVTQPDGSSVTLKLVGDEFYDYYTTTDGYTLVRSSVTGAFEYARLDGGQLVSTGVVAHDAGNRTAAEQSLLAGTQRHLTDRVAVEKARRARAKDTQGAKRLRLFDYSNFRSLIILVNYNDRQFLTYEMTGETPLEFYNAMVNQRNFQGFNSNDGFVACTGSLRDYFYDQSLGVFDPQFDIVEVTVDYSVEDAEAGENAGPIFEAAIRAADDQVDYSKYDLDDDGEVDMVFFLVAGYGSNYTGNNENYMWPHKFYLFDYDEETGYYPISADGVEFGPYACSVELYGWEALNDSIPDGIGTMVHEFGHVLGLPDLYDTNYEEDGQSQHPGKWDVMAGGGYNNYGRTPVGYCIWERYALEFAQPDELNASGDYSLRHVAENSEGYILRSPVDDEFFMIENRQQAGWDAYLPGHGMMVVRIDSTDVDIWEDNIVNARADRLYYEILRAGNGTAYESDSDPFPGTANVTYLSSLTTPALKTWNGTPCGYAIGNITENEGLITFTLINDSVLVGDINGDGEVNGSDINVLIDIVLGKDLNDYEGRVDLNQDGEVNGADINVLIDIVLGK